MILYIISIILLILAAICNSIMDTLDHHFNKSIFSKLNNKKWWDYSNSWKNKYIDGDPKKGRIKILFNINKPVQITDAWHLFKTLMIIFICISLSINLYIGCILIDNSILLNIIIYGISWNLSFSLFYNKLLLNRKL